MLKKVITVYFDFNGWWYRKLTGLNYTFAEIQYLSKQREFSLYHQNIRGLDAHYEGLYKILDSHRGMDLISLSETHTTEEEEKQYAIDGYKHFIRSRKNGEGGGVAFYIREGIKWDRRYDLESKSIECLWVETFIKNRKVFLYVHFIALRIALSKNFETDFNNMIIKANISSKKNNYHGRRQRRLQQKRWLQGI